jgi:hypothetical protein
MCRVLILLNPRRTSFANATSALVGFSEVWDGSGGVALKSQISCIDLNRGIKPAGGCRILGSLNGCSFFAQAKILGLEEEKRRLAEEVQHLKSMTIESRGDDARSVLGL